MTKTQLTRQFHRFVQRDTRFPGSVRTSDYIKSMEFPSVRLISRLFSPKGSSQRFLTFDQFLNVVYDFCAAEYWELPALVCRLFNPKMHKGACATPRGRAFPARRHAPRLTAARAAPQCR